MEFHLKDLKILLHEKNLKDLGEGEEEVEEVGVGVGADQNQY